MAKEKEDKTTKKEVKEVKKKTTVKKPAVKKAATPKKTVKKAVVAKKVEVKETPKKKEVFSGKYFNAIGRRKTAVARIRLYENGKNQITVNEKDYRDYFQTESMQSKVR